MRCLCISAVVDARHKCQERSRGDVTRETEHETRPSHAGRPRFMFVAGKTVQPIFKTIRVPNVPKREYAQPSFSRWTILMFVTREVNHARKYITGNAHCYSCYR